MDLGRGTTPVRVSSDELHSDCHEHEVCRSLVRLRLFRRLQPVASMAGRAKKQAKLWKS